MKKYVNPSISSVSTIKNIRLKEDHDRTDTDTLESTGSIIMNTENFKKNSISTLKNKPNGPDRSNTNSTKPDAHLIFDNKILSQLEGLERLLWSYRLEVNQNTTRHTENLSSEVLLKLLL